MLSYDDGSSRPRKSLVTSRGEEGRRRSGIGSGMRRPWGLMPAASSMARISWPAGASPSSCLGYFLAAHRPGEGLIRHLVHRDGGSRSGEQESQSGQHRKDQDDDAEASRCGSAGNRTGILNQRFTQPKMPQPSGIGTLHVVSSPSVAFTFEIGICSVRGRRRSASTLSAV